MNNMNSICFDCGRKQKSPDDVYLLTTTLCPNKAVAAQAGQSHADMKGMNKPLEPL